MIPVLSVRQPWTGNILVGGKDIENRSWKCPPSVLGRQILLHAGIGIVQGIPQDDPLWELAATFPNAFRQGGVVGMVTVVDCVRGSTSLWASSARDTWHWVLASPTVLPFYACAGRLGIFYVAYPYQDQMQRRLP